MMVNKTVAHCNFPEMTVLYQVSIIFRWNPDLIFSYFAWSTQFPPWFVGYLSQGMFGYHLQPLRMVFWSYLILHLHFIFLSVWVCYYFPFSFLFRFAKNIENLSEGMHGYLNAWDVQNTRTAKRGVRVCMRAPTGIPLPPTPTVQTAPLSHLMGQVWVPAVQPQAWPWVLPSHTTTDSHMHRHQLWPSLARYTQFHKVLGPCCPAVWGWSMQNSKNVHL